MRQKVQLAEAIDIAVTNGLSFIVNVKEEVRDASILYEMPGQEGDEKPKGDYDEERQTSNPRNVPNVRHQDVQNWEELTESLT